MIVSANIGGFLLVTILKQIFDRQRPDIVPQLMTYNTPSFPSGHSMMSTVAYLTLAVLLAINFSDKKVRVYIIAVALIISILIGISRIYLGVHYPTDVLAGWAVGFAWASLCGFIAKAIQYRKKRN
jgi:undecaprenyl-diphosphatase